MESQQTDAAARTRKEPQGKPDAAYLQLVREKETLILSRTRVLHELESSHNPRYRDMLNHALEDLNSKLSEVNKVCAARAASA